MDTMYSSSRFNKCTFNTESGRGYQYDSNGGNRCDDAFRGGCSGFDRPFRGGCSEGKLSLTSDGAFTSFVWKRSRCPSRNPSRNPNPRQMPGCVCGAGACLLGVHTIHFIDHLEYVQLCSVYPNKSDLSSDLTEIERIRRTILQRTTTQGRTDV